MILGHLRAGQLQGGPAVFALAQAHELEADQGHPSVRLGVAELGVGVDDLPAGAEDQTDADGEALLQGGGGVGACADAESPGAEVNNAAGPDRALGRRACRLGLFAPQPERRPHDAVLRHPYALEGPPLHPLHPRRRADAQHRDIRSVLQRHLVQPAHGRAEHVLVVLELEADADLLGRTELVPNALAVSGGQLEAQPAVPEGNDAAVKVPPAAGRAHGHDRRHLTPARLRKHLAYLPATQLL